MTERVPGDANDLADMVVVQKALDAGPKARKKLAKELHGEGCGCPQCVKDAKLNVEDARDLMDWMMDQGRWKKGKRNKVTPKEMTEEDLPLDPREPA